MSNMAGYTNAMDTLRRQYAERLRAREQELSSLLEEAQKQGLNADRRAVLQNHAHSLTGSGATYGYPDISKAARLLEEALDKGAAADAFVPLGKNLLSVCKSVSATQPPPLNLQGIKVLKKSDENKTGKIVLVVDDDRAVHDLIKEIFKNEIDVKSAHDGREGLELIGRQKPDLILLDQSMPGMDGLNFLENLQQSGDTRDIPVIMLTAHNTNAYVNKAIKSGAVNYIVKPCEREALAVRLRAALRATSFPQEK